MPHTLPQTAAQFRILPPPLKFVATLYLATAAMVCAYGIILLHRQRLTYSTGLALAGIACFEVLSTAGILQRSTFLRWTSVVIAAGAIISVVLRSPPWTQIDAGHAVRVWLKLAIHSATVVCLNTRTAEKWYQARTP